MQENPLSLEQKADGVQELLIGLDVGGKHDVNAALVRWVHQDSAYKSLVALLKKYAIERRLPQNAHRHFPDSRQPLVLHLFNALGRLKQLATSIADESDKSKMQQLLFALQQDLIKETVGGTAETIRGTLAKLLRLMQSEHSTQSHSTGIGAIRDANELLLKALRGEQETEVPN